VLTVFARGDSLFAQASGQSAFRLLSQGDHAFVAAFDAETRAVFDGTAPRAAFLDWTQGGATTRAPRIP
jgi:hypothetical protein